MICETSIRFDSLHDRATARVRCVPTPALLERILKLGGHQELTIEAPAPNMPGTWDCGEAIVQAILDGTLVPTRVELEATPGRYRVAWGESVQPGMLVALGENGYVVRASPGPGRHRRGDQVVVRWVDGWDLPREAGGRTGVVYIADQQPRRVGVKIDGLPGGGWWWVPPSALRPASQPPLMRWAACPPGQPWRRS